MKPLLHLDLFSGIGGFILAAQRAGFQTVQAVEIEPFCQSVLRKHFPDLPVHGDIRTYDATHLRGTIGLLTGGFPCQDISVAGKQAGIEGARSGLWAEMFRVLCECRPAFVLVENVPNLRNKGADRVLGDLEGAGYTAGAFVVGADNIGATHRRKRVWIVAYDALRRGNEPRSPSDKDAVSDRGEWQDRRLSGTLAHANGTRAEVRVSGQNEPGSKRKSTIFNNTFDALADTGCPATRLLHEREHEIPKQPDNGGLRSALPRFPPARNDFRGWASVASVDASLMPCVEREVCDVVDGLPADMVQRRRKIRTDRSLRNATLKALGNAIVPDNAELFLRFIYQQLS